MEQPTTINYNAEQKNEITIGAITLSSPFTELDDLVQIMLKILKDKDVKNYLKVFEYSNSIKYAG